MSFSPEGYDGPRSAATAIYFLLHPGEQSRWHGGAAPVGQAPVLVSCVVAPGFDFADFRLHRWARG